MHFQQLPGTLLTLGIIIAASVPSSSQNVAITLDKALQIARSNHAGLKGMQLIADQQNILRDAGIRKPLAQVFLSGEEFGFKEQSGIHSLNLQQSFYLPQAAKAQRAVYQGDFEMANAKVTLADSELRRQVGQAYYRVVFTRAENRLAAESLALYQGFLEVTQAQMAAGETGKIPQLAARTRLGQAALTLEHSDERHEVALLLFNQWLQADTLYDAAASLVMPGVTAFDSTLDASPVLHVQQAQVRQSIADVTYQEAQLLPQINSGVRLQTNLDDFPLFGYQLGVNVPLFAKSYRGRIEAARLQVKASEMALEATTQEIARKVSELQYRLQHLTHILEYLVDDLTPIVTEHTNANLAAYREGEIGYLEYLDSLEQILTVRKQYLDALYEFRVMHLELEFWSGQ